MILYILHTRSRVALERCEQIMQSNDSLLCLGEAATLLCGVEGVGQHKPYVLREDIDSRGLSSVLHQDVRCIDYDTFAQLAVDHQKIVRWRFV